MADKPSWTRRESIGGIGALLSGGALATGTASASEGARLNSKLSVKNGRVVTEGQESKKYSADDNLLNVDVETKSEAVDFAAAVLNQGIEMGHLSVFERGEKLRVKPLTSADDVSTTGCGKDEFNWNTYSNKAVLDIYMDEQTTESVLVKLRAGAAISAVVSIVLLASGVGSVPGFISGLLGIALEAAYQTIDIIREGCGVRIKYTKYYNPLKKGGTEVTPQ